MPLLPSRRLAGLLCAGVLLLGACGYSVVRYGGGLGDVRRVALRGLTNDTFEPGVEALVSEALTREFRQRGALRLVDDPAAADLVIRGAVKRIVTRRRSFSSILFALEYEVRMELGLAIERRDGTTVAIDPNALAESERYLASSDLEVTRTNRQEALRRLSGLLAGRVHDALYERAAR